MKSNGRIGDVLLSMGVWKSGEISKLDSLIEKLCMPIWDFCGVQL